MKKINGKINKTKKGVIIFIVILLFLFFTCSSLILSNRKYFFIENGLKNASLVINSFFVKNSYSNNNFENSLKSSRVNYLEKENNELRKNLELKKINHDYVISEVVNHTAQTWFDKIDINVGTKKNVQKGMPIVNNSGLIGFISKTSENMSEVKLLTSVDSNNMISVIIQTENGDVAGVLSKYAAKKRLFKVTDIMDKKYTLDGCSVNLSGYDNGSYKGIFIGKVIKEETSNYGLSRTIWVESGVNFDDLLFVAVVK